MVCVLRMERPIFKKAFSIISVVVICLLITGCEWMEDSGKGFESVATEDVVSGSRMIQPVEYEYVVDGHERHKLDFYAYEERSDSKRPTLIWIHGGAWIAGDKSKIDPLAYRIAGLGKYNLISINYRLANDTEAPWPEIVYDVNAAIRWVKLNSAELGIDPDKLILAGESAGAHLAAMSAFADDVEELKGDKNPGVSTDVRAVVLFYGPYNMSSLAVQKNSAVKSGMCKEPQYSSPILELLDCPETNGSRYNIDSCDLKKVRAADPCAYVDKSDPPVFLAHGEHDCIVPWGQSKALHDELDDVGVKNVFVSVEGGEHDISTLGIEPSSVVAFIQESLVEEKESVSDAGDPSLPDKTKQ